MSKPVFTQARFLLNLIQIHLFSNQFLLKFVSAQTRSTAPSRPNGLQHQSFQAAKPYGQCAAFGQTLQDQIQLTELFDRAKARLEAREQLTSNDLQKCDVFVTAVNEASKASHILYELSLLSLGELAFVSICFRQQQIQKLLPLLPSSKVRDYTQTRQIPNLQRREILIRLSRLAKERKRRFEAIIKPILPSTQNIVPTKRQAGVTLPLTSPGQRGLIEDRTRSQ